MLVISRKKDEGFLVGDKIKVTVVEISKDRVRIGIDAPNDVKIVRNELYDTEKFNMQAAVNKPSADFLAKFVNK
ncbi:MAG: carbon storage regulator [Oscillospiraceae bacterium]|nr:carbon storage regulator [Oscillospiraceae bacterium]